MNDLSPIWLVVMGFACLILGRLSWQHPFWIYDLGLWLGNLVEGNGSERKARWKAAHPEAESVSRLSIGCGFFVFAFLFLSCGLITWLFESGWGA